MLKCCDVYANFNYQKLYRMEVKDGQTPSVLILISSLCHWLTYVTLSAWHPYGSLRNWAQGWPTILVDLSLCLSLSSLHGSLLVRDPTAAGSTLSPWQHVCDLAPSHPQNKITALSKWQDHHKINCHCLNPHSLDIIQELSNEACDSRMDEGQINYVDLCLDNSHVRLTWWLP